jgi:hypothetical protein
VLEPWIIEQIRRREEEERRRERPRLEIPSRDERWKPDHEEHEKPHRDDDEDEGREKSDRGVVIIDI